MTQDSFWCPQCEKKLEGTEAQERAADTMFGEGRWWFCPTCGAALYRDPSATVRRSLDVHEIVAVLGQRALHSMWLANGVDCFGAYAEELCALTEAAQPIAGHELLRLSAGVTQTIEGNFRAFDPGAAAHWLLIRAWDGSGFYVETTDAQVQDDLQRRLQAVEEVGAARPPYVGFFIDVVPLSL